MKQGDIALAALPQVDGQSKNRPVLLLCRLPPFGDFLVCGAVSSERRQRLLANLSRHLASQAKL
jgi:mRNA interferase MazF